jgi:hypothetical protein
MSVVRWLPIAAAIEDEIKAGQGDRGDTGAGIIRAVKKVFGG